MNTRNILVATALLALSLGVLVNPIVAIPSMDIVETAIANGSFTTLVAALEVQD